MGTKSDLRIGSEVYGADGKLGEVHRVIVDAQSGHVTDLVVKHGFLFGNERIVPLSCVTKVEEGAVYLDADKQAFERFNGFTDDRYRAPDPDYVGPPGFNNTEFLLDAITAIGVASYGQVEPPLGYPGGEQISPDDLQRAAIRAGSDVLDADGEKIGEVGELSLDQDGGAPHHLTLKRGLLFKNEVDLPVAWVQEIGDKGVLLNVTKAELEQRLARQA
ncbi:MAG TPA: PRC-barrel domain-containing protein [Dehalococcoidia bacterium]|nr:PRC-barrel domain-containing protein [Dehalococcoidia bacterium]